LSYLLSVLFFAALIRLTGLLLAVAARACTESAEVWLNGKSIDLLVSAGHQLFPVVPGICPLLFRLSLILRLSTDADGIAESLGLQADPNVWIDCGGKRPLLLINDSSTLGNDILSFRSVPPITWAPLD
jgi:hypothetical protein